MLLQNDYLQPKTGWPYHRENQTEKITWLIHIICLIQILSWIKQRGTYHKESLID